MLVRIKVYNGSKYEKGITELVRVECDIKSYKVRKISDSDIIDMGSDIDPCGEYLILKFKNGDTSIFCNSFCDLCIL